MSDCRFGVSPVNYPDPDPDPDLIYGKVKFGPLCFCMGKKSKTMDFSETIVFHDIKVGRFSQLNEYMNLYEYQRSRSFIDLHPNHSDSVFLNFFSSITSDFNISSALRWAIQDQWPSGLSVVFIWDFDFYAPKFEEVDGACPRLKKLRGHIGLGMSVHEILILYLVEVVSRAFTSSFFAFTTSSPKFVISHPPMTLSS